MIDWFVSKIGIIVFVIAASAALLAFANTQVGIMETEAAAQAASAASHKMAMAGSRRLRGSFMRPSSGSSPPPSGRAGTGSGTGSTIG